MCCCEREDCESECGCYCESECYCECATVSEKIVRVRVSATVSVLL